MDYCQLCVMFLYQQASYLVSLIEASALSSSPTSVCSGRIGLDWVRLCDGAQTRRERLQRHIGIG